MNWQETSIRARAGPIPRLVKQRHDRLDNDPVVDRGWNEVSMYSTRKSDDPLNANDDINHTETPFFLFQFAQC